MATTDRELDDRVLVLTPSGRDGLLATEVLGRSGVRAHGCASIEELCAELERGGAAAMIAEEALGRRARDALVLHLRAQPAWSDLPILVIAAAARTTATSQEMLDAVSVLGNVTVLERPMRIVVLMSAVTSALRARHRQYEVRDLLDELHRGVRDRDAFLATLGHELRNPLGAIRNALAILDRIRSPDDADSAERALLRRQAGHVSRLVDDLLDVSRVTSGKIALQPEPLDLVETVRRGTDAIVATRPDQHTLRLALPSAPLMVHGDPVRLEQVVSNLLTNAVKYTPPGGHIEVELATDGADAKITVRDSGVGISADTLPRIFDLFTQAERTLDRSQGGLGIGLTLVRRLVELHGGSVVAHSEGLGLGATFVVRLPRKHQGVHPALRRQITTPPPTAPARAIRNVLLVEDNADIRETLALLLEHVGFTVVVAGDGPAGVATAERTPLDAAIVDIGLPGFDGYEVGRRLRGAFPSLYLVALTGYGQPDDRRRSKEAGFDAHLTKPVDIEVLQSLLAGRSASAS